MIDKELIENWRNTVKPTISSLLFRTNYEGMGEQDKKEFERDCDEILDLALIGLKCKAQLSREGTTKDATCDLISRQAAIDKFIDGLEEIFADLRERHGDDSVCGLCEYDGAYIGQSGDWCNECPGFEKYDCFKLSDKTRKEWTEEIIKALPSVQPVATDANVGDTISRQAAIDAAESAYVRGVFPTPFIREVPPAQPEQKWIPCNERLPEERDWYLGIFKEPDTGWINPTPFICDYLLGTKTKATTKEGWILKGHTDREEYIDYYFNLECVAWMPLPEPYKEGGADG